MRYLACAAQQQQQNEWKAHATVRKMWWRPEELRRHPKRERRRVTWLVRHGEGAEAADVRAICGVALLSGRHHFARR